MGKKRKQGRGMFVDAKDRRISTASLGDEAQSWPTPSQPLPGPPFRAFPGDGPGGSFPSRPDPFAAAFSGKASLADVHRGQGFHQPPPSFSGGVGPSFAPPHNHSLQTPPMSTPPGQGLPSQPFPSRHLPQPQFQLSRSGAAQDLRQDAFSRAAEGGLERSALLARRRAGLEDGSWRSESWRALEESAVPSLSLREAAEEAARSGAQPRPDAAKVLFAKAAQLRKEAEQLGAGPYAHQPPLSAQLTPQPSSSGLGPHATSHSDANLHASTSLAASIADPSLAFATKTPTSSESMILLDLLREKEDSDNPKDKIIQALIKERLQGSAVKPAEAEQSEEEVPATPSQEPKAEEPMPSWRAAVEDLVSWRNAMADEAKETQSSAKAAESSAAEVAEFTVEDKLRELESSTFSDSPVLAKLRRILCPEAESGQGEALGVSQAQVTAETWRRDGGALLPPPPAQQPPRPPADGPSAPPPMPPPGPAPPRLPPLPPPGPPPPMRPWAPGQLPMRPPVPLQPPMRPSVPSQPPVLCPPVPAAAPLDFSRDEDDSMAWGGAVQRRREEPTEQRRPRTLLPEPLLQAPRPEGSSPAKPALLDAPGQAETWRECNQGAKVAAQASHLRISGIVGQTYNGPLRYPSPSQEKPLPVHQPAPPAPPPFRVLPGPAVRVVPAKPLNIALPVSAPSARPTAAFKTSSRAAPAPAPTDASPGAKALEEMLAKIRKGVASSRPQTDKLAPSAAEVKTWTAHAPRPGPSVGKPMQWGGAAEPETEEAEEEEDEEEEEWLEVYVVAEGGLVGVSVGNAGEVGLSEEGRAVLERPVVVRARSEGEGVREAVGGWLGSGELGRTLGRWGLRVWGWETGVGKAAARAVTGLPVRDVDVGEAEGLGAAYAEARAQAASAEALLDAVLRDAAKDAPRLIHAHRLANLQAILSAQQPS